MVKLIWAARLKLSLQKCQLFHKRPKSIREVRSLLGQCFYYWHVVKRFADIARPLQSITGNEVLFEWTQTCEKMFQKFKSMLSSPPIVGYPSEHESFVMDADASGDGLEAVPPQVQQGTEWVITYFSRVLTETEYQCCMTRRELLAAICAVKHSHHYLYGWHFVILSGHGSLWWLLNFNNAEGQMAHWLSDPGNYDYEIQHCLGSQRGNADGLSKRPCNECTYCIHREKLVQEHVDIKSPDYRISWLKHGPSKGDREWLEPCTAEQLWDWQEENLVRQKVLGWVEAGTKPKWEAMQSEGSDARVFGSNSEELQLLDRILYQKGSETSQYAKHPWLVALPKVHDQSF